MIRNNEVERLYRSEWLGVNRLPWCDGLGGIPLVYETSFGELKCDECATNLVDDDIEHVTGVVPYYEGSAIECDGCGHVIESAYGEEEAVSDETY